MEHVAGVSAQQSQASGELLENAAASVTVLGTPPEPPLPCCIQSIEGTRMQVRVGQLVAPDAALRIDAHDSLWLGVAEACRGVPNDYILTLRLSHCLRNLPELARLAERFRGRSSRSEPAAGPVDWNV